MIYKNQVLQISEKQDLTYDNVRYTVIGTIKDEYDAPEYLKLKVNNEGIELNWQLL